MMPNVMNAVRRFERTMQFQIVKKAVVDGDVAETSLTNKTPLWFEGLTEPLSPRELLIKPEGERKFKWLTLWTDLHLTVDSIIKDENNALYRIMNSSDWHDAGYAQYQMIEGPGL